LKTIIIQGLFDSCYKVATNGNCMRMNSGSSAGLLKSGVDLSVLSLTISALAEANANQMDRVRVRACTRKVA
jgi:hypothetical protein